jgi:hypothetical protein
MKNSFSDLLSRQQTKFSGTTATYAAEPAISGYFFSIFHLPVEIKNAMDVAAVEFLETADKEYVLACAIRNIDVPNLFDIQIQQKVGIGGTKFSVPTAINVVETMTIGFYEYYGYTISKLINAWASAIFDHTTGLSRLSNFTQSTYKATLDIAYFDPSGSKTTAALRCYGVFPSTVPTSNWGTDIGTNNLVEITVQFNVDRIITVPCLEAELENVLKSEAEKIRTFHGKC